MKGLNDSDYDEILNMLEEDFNIVSDADLTDLLDTFDPFSIEDPNLPLPVVSVLLNQKSLALLTFLLLISLLFYFN